MDYDEISAELEQEWLWRSEEIRKLNNMANYLRNDDEMNIHIKTKILILYSHFEGFCKFMFLFCLSHINKGDHLRQDLIDELVACSLNDTFLSYENLSKKCKEFKRALPDDTSLHRFSRQKTSVCQMNNFLSQKAQIPDTIVDTESNLKPIVLKKILYRLGFDISLVDFYAGDIDHLLEIRNKIAHGNPTSIITASDYENLEKKVNTLIEDIKVDILTSLRNKYFLK